MATQAATNDVGHAIADYLEDQEVFVDENVSVTVDVVVRTDPSNLIVVLDNGQTFTVRVIAGP